MQRTIETAQAKINSTYHDNITEELPYNNYVIPIISPILQELKTIPPDKWYRKESSEVHIDAYVEALSLFMLYNYIRDIEFDYPLFSVVLVLVKHTFFIHIFQYKKNIDEWNAYRKLLYAEFMSIKASIPNLTGINALQTLIGEDIVVPESPTSIYLLNQLFGFKYNPKAISIASDELIDMLNPTENSGFMLIHLSYNLNELSSILFCKPIVKSTTKLLNINTITNVQPFKHPNNIFISTMPYTLCDVEFNMLETASDKERWYMLLCYDDEEDLVTSHYTLIESSHISSHDLNNIIEGRIMNKIDPKILNSILHDNYIATIPFKIDSSEHVAKNIIYATTIVKNIFNDTHSQSEFVNRLLSEEDELLKIIDRSELPYFKVFMSRYANGVEFTYDSAHSYVMSYFGVDASLMIGDLV